MEQLHQCFSEAAKEDAGSGEGVTIRLVHYMGEQAKRDALDAILADFKKENPDINVFTGKRFDETESENPFDMNSLIEVDQNALKTAFKIDSSKIKIDFSNVNNLISQTNLPALDLNDVISKLDFSLSNDDMKIMMNELVKDRKSGEEKGWLTLEAVEKNLGIDHE